MTTQTTPVYAPVKAIIAEYGLSKSTLHRKLTAWLIKGKKIGRTTLVDEIGRASCRERVFNWV